MITRLVRHLLWLVGAVCLVDTGYGHRIDSLSATVDFTPDGTEVTLEVSAEAQRVLTATEGLSLFSRFQAGGATAEEVAADVFTKAATYFPERLALWFDGKPVPFPPLAMSRLEIDERDAVAPEQAGTAADRKHLFLVGKWTGPVPTGATTCQIDVIGDSVVVVSRQVGGKPVGRAVPEFPGMQSKVFPVPVPGQAAAAASAAVEGESSGHGFGYFVYQGFRHIVPEGLDHILFVLGLFFLTREFKPLLWQVTAFTIAHSITLALAMLNIVRLPSQPVEVAIAVSIAFVAIENLFRSNLSVWRPFVIFGFGLIHGLGFAGAFKEMLGETSRPASGEFASMLVGFNVGVELGQLAVIGGAFLAVGWFWKRAWYRPRIAIPASVLIAGCGLYWAVTRVLESGG